MSQATEQFTKIEETKVEEPKMVTVTEDVVEKAKKYDQAVKEKERRHRRRNWIITFHTKYYPDDSDVWKRIRYQFKEGYIRGVLVGPVETDEDDCEPHRHAVIQFESPKSLHTLKKFVGKQAHLEEPRSLSESKFYSSCEGHEETLFICLGEFLTQGQRTEVEKILAKYDDIEDFIDAEPSEYLKRPRGYDKLFKVKNRKRDFLNWCKTDDEPEVIYCTGAAGEGKTYAVKKIGEQEAKAGKDCAMVTFDQNGFATIIGDEDPEVLILNEFRDSRIKFTEFLGLLTKEDGVNVKGEDKHFFFNCKKIYITSIIPPEELYSKVFESKKQIQRRINEIRVYEKYNYTVREWKDTEDDF